MAVYSSRTVHTWLRVHWVQIHLVQVDRLLLQCRHRCRSLRTSESTGLNFVSPKNRTSDLTLTLHCTTNMHTFPFPFPLPDATSPLSNPVSLNNMDRVACCSSSTCRASSAFHIASSCCTAASVFHLAHNGCASSILATMWLVTCGSIP